MSAWAGARSQRRLGASHPPASTLPQATAITDTVRQHIFLLLQHQESSHDSHAFSHVGEKKKLVNEF